MDPFQSKRADLFASLDAVSFKPDSSLNQPHKSSNPPRSGSSDRARRQSGPTEDFKDRESIFKEDQDVGGFRKGEAHDPRRRPPPAQPRERGFKRPRHPPQRGFGPRDKKKYTKYSLAGVSEVTDRSNSQAAFAFLQERQELRAKQEKDRDFQDPEASSNKISFKKPKRSLASSEVPASTSSLQGKRIMPEAVVGQTKSFKKKAKIERSSESKSSQGSGAKLSHLSFDDEDD